MRLSCDSNALDLIVRSATWHIEGVVVFYEESWKLETADLLLRGRFG
jgi:hypothetical protein